MAPARLEHARILVVDGYVGWRDGIATALAEAGYHVHACRTAAEALRTGLAPGVGLDLLLTEADLRDMSGPELGRRLRQAHPGLRVLFMGYALNDRGAAQLSKPFSLLRLERVVSRTLVRPPVRSITRTFAACRSGDSA